MLNNNASVRVTETDGGYAIEFVNNVGRHVDWFTKRDGSVKTWREAEHAMAVVGKYGWNVYQH